MSVRSKIQSQISKIPTASSPFIVRRYSHIVPNKEVRIERERYSWPRATFGSDSDIWVLRLERFPRNLAEVATRQKEIQYSSRTRAFTDYFKHVTKLRNMIAELLEELPPEMKQSERVKFLSSAVERHAANIVQLIYRPQGYEGDSKDYEFSRSSMEEHWRAGHYDAIHALRHPEILERPTGRYETLVTFDPGRDGDN